MIVPYEKEIVFNTKIKEICSISLEYEANVLDEELSGDFILVGEYKVHELSVNKEPFKYRIPFSIELSDDIIRDSIKHDINNFTYEIVDEDTLKVNIEFNITYEVVEDKVKKEEIEEQEKKNEVEENTEERINIPSLDIPVDTILPKEEKEDNKIEEPNTPDNIVLNNSLNTINTYVTNHIHILDDGESIDSISLKYNVPTDVLKEYNDNIKWEKGSKVLIPENSD